MKKLGIAIVAILTVFLSHACSVDQLEQMIIRSDLSSIKNIISEISVDQETKSQLIELASDIIIKRLKDKELINFEKISNPDELKIFNRKLNFIRKIIKANLAGTFAGLGMLFSPLITNNKTPIAIGLILILLCPIGLCGSLIWQDLKIDKLIAEARLRITTLYDNAIEIKHILHKLRTTTGFPEFRSARLRKLQKSWQQ